MEKMNKLKVILLFSSIVLMILGFIYVRNTWDTSIKETSRQALIIARTSETALNGEMLKQLRAVPEDVGTIAYESIKKRLMDLRRADENIRFAYIYAQKEGKIYFMADSEPVDSKDYSPPGQEYTEADSQSVRPFMDGQVLITEPATDRWGTWVSILVPMKDSETSEVRAVFGIDYPSAEWNDEAFSNTLRAGIIVFILFLLLFAFNVIINNGLRVKESEEKHRLLIENSRDIIYTLTREGVFTFVSPAWTALLGHPLNQVVGHPFQSFVHPDDFPGCMLLLQKVVETEEQQEGIEYRVRHVNGSWRWYTSSAAPLRDNTGKVISFEGIARDITEQKMAEEALLESEEKLRGIFESISDAVTVTDMEGNIIEVNEAAVSLWGYTGKKELIGRKGYEFIAKEHRPTAIQDAKEVLVRGRAKEVTEFNFVRKDGSIFSGDVRAALRRDNSGKPAGFISVVRNITERKKAEEALVFSNIILRTQQETSIDGILVVDEKGAIISFNRHFIEIWGIPQDVIESKSDERALDSVMNKLVNPEEFIMKVKHLYEFRDEISRDEIIMKDGRTLDRYSAPMFGDKGKYYGRVWYFRDITKEKEVDKMKSEFVSVASHQLRTPSTGIKWFSELILKNKITSTVKNYVKQIETSNERMIRLVDDLLNVSHIETGDKFNVVLKNKDIVPLVESTLKEQAVIAAKKHIELMCSKDAPGKLVLPIDELKIRQVFQNLISNAIKYSKEKTKIVLGCQQKKKEVIFFVKDKGIGIPKHQQNQVFTKFFRAENALTVDTDGTGLGLYIVKAIVEAHGGKIWFESEAGKGTTFYFSLPLSS